MSFSASAQVWSLIFWFLAVINGLMAVSLVLLGPRRMVRRWLGITLLVMAVDYGALGLWGWGGSGGAMQAVAFAVAVATAAVLPLSLLACLLLFWRRVSAYVRNGLLVLAVLPLLLSSVDLLTGEGLWYVPPPEDPVALLSMISSPWQVYQGYLYPFLGVVYFYLVPLLTLVLLFYAAVMNQVLSAKERATAWVLLVVGSVALAMQIGGAFSLVRMLLSGVVLTAGWVHAVMHELMEAWQRRSHRLSARLIVAVLASVLFVAGVGGGAWLVLGRERVVRDVTARLRAVNQAVKQTLYTWLAWNGDVLGNVLVQPDVVSMVAARQEPWLTMVAQLHPYVYLASTLGMDGLNVARSDGMAPVDYHEREWFIRASRGTPLVFQRIQGRTYGEMALAIAAPIRKTSGEVVGVGMLAVTLKDIVTQMWRFVGEDADVIYVVDEGGRLLAYVGIGAVSLQEDFSNEVPVIMLRHGRTGTVRFVDREGISWWAYADWVTLPRSDDRWGVVVQRPASAVLAETRRTQYLVWGGVLGGGVLSFVLFAFIAFGTLYPLSQLAEEARAVAAGERDQVTSFDGRDEVAVLARALNQIVRQLQVLRRDFEARVEERTRQLERRAEYLAVTGEVSRVAASILDVDELLDRVVHLIADRFHFYHAGIFLLDEAGEWAVLRAASSEGGRRMLARGHRLRVGREGVVGYVSATGRPRIALDVAADEAWLPNPDLPDTRSEMGLPLTAAGGRVIGVLDVQSEEPEAFTDEDIATLRILADQIAVAIVNARLFRDNQRVLEDLRRLYGEEMARGWARRRRMLRGYRYTGAGARPLTDEEYDELGRDVQRYLLEQVRHSSGGSGTRPLVHRDAERNLLFVPLRFAGSVLGMVRFRRSPERPWTQHEVEFASKAAVDIAQALENARLLSDARERATRDRLVGEIAGRLRASLDMDVIMQTAVQELGRVLGAEMTLIQVSGPDGDGGEEDRVDG